MKKIVDGKIYDTENAEFICSRGQWSGWKDSGDWIERLYLSKKGQFFLYYWYGKTSPNRKRCSWGLEVNEGMELLSKEEAKKFLEKAECSEKIYTRFFNVVEW